MVTEMIENLPPDEKKIAYALRSIILDTLPSLREKLSYGVPYFFHKSRICFLWPASVPNGGILQGVSLGFCKGYLMANEEDFLQAHGRKQVFAITYLRALDVNPTLIRQWLHQAFLLDQIYQSAPE